MPIQAASLSADRLAEFIRALCPNAHGHLVKALTAFVMALVIQTSGCQAELARAFANFEAATRRLSRLLHNPRLCPRWLADQTLAYALTHLPPRGPVRVVIDWTREGDHHLLVVSLVVGRRALPLYWRAYAASVLKGRMGRYEQAVLRRVLTALVEQVGPRRVRVLADRGFADVDLCDFLAEFGVFYLIRVKASTKVFVERHWRCLNQLRFLGNAHFRNLGRVRYCESSPHRLWVNLARRKLKGRWEKWYLLSNRPVSAQIAATEYGRRMGIEESFRDAKWWLGFADAQIHNLQAWSRMFALCVLTMWAVMALATTLLLTQPSFARDLLRRVCARRRGRWPLSVFKAMLCLLQQTLTLLNLLEANIIFDLDARLPNVS